MKKWQFILAACVLTLAGCAPFESCRQCAIEGFDPRVVRLPNPLLPNVFVVDRKYLVVDQEPIRLDKGHVGQDGRVTISWALAARTPYAFAPNIGISFVNPAPEPRLSKKIDRPDETICKADGELGKIYVCSFKPKAGKATYKYTVHVVNKENPREVIEPLDPYVETNI